VCSDRISGGAASFFPRDFSESGREYSPAAKIFPERRTRLFDDPGFVGIWHETKDELMQVYALGAREGEDLKVELAAPLPGMRVTLYKILHEPNGSRYLSMPSSVYFDKPGETFFQEKLGPFREAFFIITFEKTDSSERKDINVRYFEERVRKLVIGAYKTNFLFSSLKIRMKDFADPDAKVFFERDAQLLVNRLMDPRRIFLIRVWKAGKAT